MEFDSKELRKALGTFATGVTVVTTRDEAGRDAGLTVNSFSSVSLDPPLILWSLAKSSLSRAAFMRNDSFAVHILAEDQAELSMRFATRGADKFAGLELERGHDNLPLLKGCSARLQCKTASRYDGGDHDIIVGEVVAFEECERPALVFLAGRYAVANGAPSTPQIPDSPARQGEDDLFEIGMVNSLQYLIGRAHYQSQLGIRPELARLGLSEVEFYIIAGAALNAPCTIDELRNLVAVSGFTVGPADISRLERRGFLSVEDGEAKQAVVHVTDAGRAVLTRLAVINKAIENDAVKGFTRVEIENLKQMLRRVIQHTLPPWRKPL
jgi:3-hydroxy-9,10-secoandrosta-1,3,5(10)-triene-9,17-dione monooxygenase reductase component